jgi:hypothetical protein
MEANKLYLWYDLRVHSIFVDHRHVPGAGGRHTHIDQVDTRPSW